MRRALDGLYAAGAALAAIFLVLMTVLVVLQIGARLIGAQVPSADDFARLSMAASAFLGLAFTLRTGGHIRVMLVIERLPPATRHVVEILCLTAAALVSAWFAWSTGVTTYESWSFGEFTIGTIPIPKWIPLAAMTFGIALIAIAFIDDLLAVFRHEQPSYQRPSEYLNES